MFVSDYSVEYYPSPMSICIHITMKTTIKSEIVANVNVGGANDSPWELDYRWSEWNKKTSIKTGDPMNSVNNMLAALGNPPGDTAAKMFKNQGVDV